MIEWYLASIVVGDGSSPAMGLEGLLGDGVTEENETWPHLSASVGCASPNTLYIFILYIMPFMPYLHPIPCIPFMPYIHYILSIPYTASWHFSMYRYFGQMAICYIVCIVLLCISFWATCSILGTFQNISANTSYGAVSPCTHTLTHLVAAIEHCTTVRAIFAYNNYVFIEKLLNLCLNGDKLTFDILLSAVIYDLCTSEVHSKKVTCLIHVGSPKTSRD